MVNCLNCNKQIKQNKFCSRSCAASYNNKLYPKRKRIKWTCTICKKEIKRKRKYCKLCNPQNKDYSKITIREIKDSNGFKCNHFSQIRELARRIMRQSNLNNDCIICDEKETVVCHIKEIRNFSDDDYISTVNNIKNLVYLCRNCHWKLDHGMIDRDLIMLKLKLRDKQMNFNLPN